MLAVVFPLISLYAQPRIFSGPEADSLFDGGFRVRWSTLSFGDSKLVYGLGESLTDTVESAAQTKDHQFVLSGLKEGAIYALRAYSTNIQGTSESATHYAVTLTPSSTGTIEAYFNYAVDASPGFPEQAHGGADLGQLILGRIDQAVYSIDLALYSFSDYTGAAKDVASDVANALVAAKNRGVKVRMVYDNRANTIPVNTLISAGIPVSKRPISGIMHNKFWVFDARDTASATDDWVVTGSWNMTDGGTYLDAQNAVFIQDKSLAVIYTKEFEEMFGSSTDTPDGSAARFGPQKLNNTPHRTIVGGRRVEVYFSPSDGANSIINSMLQSAGEDIFFGLLVFTRDDLGATLIARRDAGAVVRGIINDIDAQSSEYPVLLNAGVDVLPAGNAVVSGVFHHKYAIVDPFNDASDPLVITGSHNWSSSADTDNDENTLVIHSGPLARQYVREFSERFKESGGTGVIVSVEDRAEIPVRLRLSEAFPNPFNPSTSFVFSVPGKTQLSVVVYDMLGRVVDTLATGTFEAGTYRIHWSPRGASGTYYVTLQTPGTRLTRKAVLVH